MSYEQMAALYGFLSYAVPGCIGVFGIWLYAVNRKR